MYVVMCSARRSEESLSTASRSDVDFVKLACEVLLVIDKASHFKTKSFGNLSAVRERALEVLEAQKAKLPIEVHIKDLLSQTASRFVGVEAPISGL